MSNYAAQVDSRTWTHQPKGGEAREVIAKAASDEILIHADFTKLLGGDAALGEVVSVTFDPAEPVVAGDGISNDGQRVSFKVTGGVSGTRYKGFVVVRTNTGTQEQLTGRGLLDVL